MHKRASANGKSSLVHDKDGNARSTLYFKVGAFFETRHTCMWPEGN